MKVGSEREKKMPPLGALLSQERPARLNDARNCGQGKQKADRMYQAGRLLVRFLAMRCRSESDRNLRPFTAAQSQTHQSEAG